jgi:hypothetical protein
MSSDEDKLFNERLSSSLPDTPKANPQDKHFDISIDPVSGKKTKYLLTDDEIEHRRNRHKRWNGQNFTWERDKMYKSGPTLTDLNRHANENRKSINFLAIWKSISGLVAILLVAGLLYIIPVAWTASPGLMFMVIFLILFVRILLSPKL